MNTTTIRRFEAFRKTTLHRLTPAETVALARRIAARVAKDIAPEHAAASATALGLELVRHALAERADQQHPNDHEAR